MAMTLRTDAELDAALTELAEAEGTSKQEVIRAAVLDRRARMSHASDVEESANRQLDRWKDVIDRLGTV